MCLFTSQNTFASKFSEAWEDPHFVQAFQLLFIIFLKYYAFIFQSVLAAHESSMFKPFLVSLDWEMLTPMI